jgi:hypothetical protein
MIMYLATTRKRVLEQLLLLQRSSQVACQRNLFATDSKKKGEEAKPKRPKVDKQTQLQHAKAMREWNRQVDQMRQEFISIRLEREAAQRVEEEEHRQQLEQKAAEQLLKKQQRAKSVELTFLLEQQQQARELKSKLREERVSREMLRQSLWDHAREARRAALLQQSKHWVKPEELEQRIHFALDHPSQFPSLMDRLHDTNNINDDDGSCTATTATTTPPLSNSQ